MYHTENDDQALHFLNFISHPDWYQLDSKKTIHAMIDRLRGDLTMCDDPNIPDSICAAPVLHGSRAATRGQWERMCKAQWWQEDEQSREQIPVQLPDALEINAVYGCNLKCEHCTHMSRFLKGQASFEDIHQWITNWKERLQPNEVRILGGEPFLHKHLDWIQRAEINAKTMRHIFTC